MDFPSTKRVREQSDSTGPQESSPAAPSAAAATFERQLSEIGSSGEGAMPAASTPQPAQSKGILRRLSKSPLYSQDAPLILGLEKALIKGGAAKGTARNNLYSLRSFGQWLFANNKDPIAARLDDEESLTVDARVFEKRPATLLRAIDHLRTSRSTGGIVPIAGRTELHPYPQDAALIEGYKNDAATDTGKKDASKNATALRSFSDYLRENSKKGIAARLSDEALDGDVKSYKKDAGADSRIGAALAHLRKSQAGPKAMELERHIDPEDAALMESRQVGDAAAQHSAWQKAGSWPEELLPAEGHDQDLGRMDEPGPSSSAPQPAQSTGILIGHDKQPLHTEDAPLISGLEEALRNGNAAERTARGYVRTLLSFGHWLFANNKDPIAARLDDEKSLTADAREFIGKGNPLRLLAAIVHLRTSQSTGGVVRIAGRTELHPYPQDAALIEEYKNEAATDTGKKDASRKDATALRSFSDYLRDNNRPGIAAGLGTSFDGDVESYRKVAGADFRIGAALGRLRKSQAGAEAMEHERHIDPEEAALRESRRVGDAAAQHIASQKGGSWPEELLPAEGHDQDLLLGLMDEPGASSSAPQSTWIVIGKRKQPLYSVDAPLISGLERALIKGGFSKSAAEQHGGSLRSFSRWLFAKEKPSIRDRLDNKSLTDGGEVLEFTGEGNPKTLVQAIDYLRTLRSTGEVPISRRAKLNPHPQNVAFINPEDTVLMEPRRVDAAAAQHSASQETGRRPEELPAEGRDQDLLLGLMDEPRSSSSLEPAARHDQAPDPGEPDRQQSPDEPMAALARSNRLPSEEVLINDEHDTAELRPAKRQRTLNNPQGVAGERQLSEIANSGGQPTPAPTHQQGTSSWETQPMLLRSGYEDVTAPHAVATYVGGAAAQHSARQRAVSRPLVLPEGYDQDLRLMVEDGPSWPEVPPEQAQDIVQAGQEPARPTVEAAPTHSARARSNTYGGIEVSFNPNSPASFELRDNACSPAPGFPPPFAGPVPGHHQGAQQLGSPQGLSPVSAHSDDDALAWLSEELARQMQEPASPSTARAQDLYRGFKALLDPDVAELDDSAHFAPAPSARARSDTYGGLEVSFNPNSPTSFELRDNAWSRAPGFPPPFAGPVPGHHQGARQLGSPQGLSPVSAHSDDDALAWLSEELARQMQEPASPSTARAQDLYRGFGALLDPDAAELDDSAHFAPAPSARARSDTYDGLPLVDLTAPAPSPLRDDIVRRFPITSSDAQIGALNPIALSHNRGLVLEDTEWLGDEHILRDYQLQELDLQRSDSDLAARTRFVDPLEALRLRLGAESDVLRVFHRIVHDRRDNDTADFLLLPVNDASATDRGRHWSLLFVDRSNRQRPVAYHYDSYGRYNETHARQLAERLNLALQPAGMAQQQNTCDCGVFVVDGTRELVRQLAQGREPDQLNLSNVVANRQALQARLRG
ncbi:Ulp1 family isopeptidase [Bradyrhizobium diazoefficiens]|uniref:Ulp1 family isopeptidase n=1 Tax=Bradyrhizobium diazoefficiens TaxID=1355477 RepID=UPI002B46DB3F|nr:Ulp1 family isopeptidase [Bradyrhizobium diazoefficiens]WRJ30639.1 Ulp1 family isopeptidase [Bradyrhizobium diazoefficiens]